MANQPLARGQATIQTLNDAYTINQSVSSYVFAAANNGTVVNAVTVTSTVKVTMGEVNITGFTIGAVAKPAGFSTITVNNTNKTITYTVAANTANLPDTGAINIPVTIAGNVYHLSFAWSKTRNGATGPAGADANLLDWVKDWNTNKTVIGTSSVITPKIFAGVKNANGTLTGLALGRFALSTLNASGQITTETIDGIYGFKDGNKTFFIDNGGNVQLGRGNQYIKYNAVTGKIEFGGDVSLNWVNAINTAKNAAVAAAATDAAGRINSLRIGIRNYIKNSAFAVTGLSGLLTVDGVTAVLDTATRYQEYNTIKITQTAATGTAANTSRAYFTALKQCNPASFSMWVKASAATNLRIRIGGNGTVDIPVDTAWKQIKLENRVPTSTVVLFGATTTGVVYNIALPMLVEATKAADWSPAPEDLYGGINNAKAVADAITKKANDEKWATKLTYIDSTGIFTGTLSANTVNALKINASQITTGTIDAARLNVAVLKSSLITADNINALTLAVNKGTVGGWTVDGDSIFRGAKNNTASGYTAVSGAITIGSNGVRGFKWKLDANGAGAVAGGNISWDATGKVTFGSSVSLNWTNAANDALASAKTYADTKKTEAVNAAAADAAGKIKALQIGGANLLNNSGNWRTAGWNGGFTSNGGGYTVDESVLYNGKPALKTLVGTGLQHPWIKLENGVEYTYSAMVMCNETIAGNGNTPLHYHSGLNNVNQSKLTVISHDTSVTANTWKKIYITFKLTGDADSFRPFFYRGANSTTTYRIAHIKLERGNKATDWTPSASDTAADIADARTTGINARAVADAITRKANDEKWAGKLTYIDATGIFTGTLSANTVNAVKINASQITAGTIDAARINVAALKTALITAANIDALSLNVTKGKIGGWTIGADHITAGSVGTTGQMPVQIRSAAAGSGYWYSGAYKPQGIVMTWHQSNNAGHFVFGQIAATGNSVKTGFIGIQMMAWDNTEYFCLSANYTKSGAKEVYNRIAGWAFDNDSIYRGTKNNTAGALTAASGSITIGSNGIRGFKWRLDTNGAGAMAGGNISWDANGNVTFGSSVSLNWTNAANNALSSAKTYADTKKTEAMAAAATDATTKSNAAKELAQAMAFGKMLYRDPVFYNGNNGVRIYNNANNGSVTVSRISDATAPNDSKYVLQIKNTGASSPNCGGFCWATMTSYRKIFITRIIARIPTGRNIGYHSNSIGTGGTQKWLTPVAGTGDWCEYVCKVTCGTANFSSTHHFAITGAVGTTEAPVEWRVAYATVFDITSSEKYTTTIDGNGIYTSTLNANQITAGTISADRIAAGSIAATKLDAASIKSSIVNAGYINGLTCAFVRGKIGGWAIGGDTIMSGAFGVGNIPIQLRSSPAGSGYIYNGAYKPYGLTMSWHQSSNAGHFVFGQVMANGNTVKTGFIGIQMMAWDHTEYFCLSANHTKSGSKEVYNRIAGWAFDNDSIYRGTKNNAASAYTAASGFITIGSNGIRGFKWRLDSNGAGVIAGGNISWDANGNVTFGSSVSLKWTQYTDTALNRLTVGGRNYALETSNAWSAPVTLANTLNQCIFPYRVLADSWKAGDVIQVSFDYKYGNIARNTAYANEAAIQGSGNVTGWGAGGFNYTRFFNQIDFVKKSGTLRVCYSFTVTADHIKNGYFDINFRHDYLTGVVYIKSLKVEKGTKATDWTPAPEDISSRLTRITSTGVYTGSITAGQISIDSALVVGGSAHNGSISVRDASNTVKVTLDRTGITAVGGTIGGWTIASNQISKNSVVLSSDGSITNGARWKLNNDGSGQFANGNISWTAAGTVTVTGTINASAGTIGGFEIGYGRIGSTASGSGSGGGLAIYNDLFRVGSSTSYVLFGDDTFPASAGGAFTATGRITNNKSNTYFTNCGVYIDVKNASRNFGVYSNAALLAPALISNKIKTVVFSGSGYSMDFAQNNLFFIYATKNLSVTLPAESSVARMFGVSSLPADFACVFTLVYNYNYGGRITINSVRNNDGSLINHAMERGDILTLLCAKFPSFHYQIFNHHQ